MRIPIVLPVLHVRINADGTLTADLDGTPYRPDHAWGRADLPDLVEQLTADRQTAVRVEVTEHDGTRYSDIATPPARACDDPSAQATAPTSNYSGAEVRGTGFRPGEMVAVAYVLLRQAADAAGEAVVHLPPAVLSSRPASVVLVGLDSKSLALLETPV